MSYVQVSRSPDIGIADYRRVERELGPAPKAGNVGHHVGVVDGSLVIVDVWESRADADRFAADRLFPAFERSGMTPTASTEITGFDAVEDPS